MAWIKPTYSEIKDEVMAIYKSYRANADSAPLSDLWIYSRVLARLGSALYSGFEAVRRDLFPSTAVGRYLDSWLFVFGLSDGNSSYGLILPSTSSGDSALKVTCTAGTPEITGETLTDTAGNRYQIDETYTFAAPGTYNADLVSIDTGLSCNLSIGEILTFESPPAGISEEAEIMSSLTGGLDAETDSEGQSRVVRELQTPSMGGNASQWVRWVEETSQGEYDAYVWSMRQNQPYGYGTTDYTALRRGQTGRNRIISSDQKNEITAYVESQAPVRQMRQSRCLDFTVDPSQIEVVFSLAPDASADKECDWDAQANQRQTAAGCNEADLLVIVDAVYPAGVLASGDTVIIANELATVDLAPGAAGAPVSGNMDRFTVESWPWSSSLVTGGPGAGPFYVTSGGGLVEDVLEAIVDYLDTLGPERGDYASTASAAWDDTIRIAWVQNAVIGAGDGDIIDVGTCEIDGATADVGPTASATTDVYIKVCDTPIGEIVIWEDKT